MDEALASSDLEQSYELWKKAQWDGETGVSAEGDLPWIWLVNIDHLSGGINGLSQSMNELGKEKNLKIHVMHEDIFHSMHRI